MIYNKLHRFTTLYTVWQMELVHSWYIITMKKSHFLNTPFYIFLFYNLLKILKESN
jgi:hypothetical protein